MAASECQQILTIKCNSYLALRFLYWKWKWKSLSRVWLFGTPWTTVRGILQARILEWVAFPFSRVSSWPRDRTQVSPIAGRFFTNWPIREAICHLINQGEKKKKAQGIHFYCSIAANLKEIEINHFYVFLLDSFTGLVNILTDIIWRFTGDFMAPDLVCRVVRYLQVCSSFQIWWDKLIPKLPLGFFIRKIV